MLRRVASSPGAPRGDRLLRRFAVGVCAGIFPVVALFVACDGSESGSPSSTGTGNMIDGKQACIDVCMIMSEHCSQSTDWCEPQCEAEFRNGGPDCLDLNNAEWACMLSTVPPMINDLPCPVEWPTECAVLSGQSTNCAWEFGCVPAQGCLHRDDAGPNGEPTCECVEYCKGDDYWSKCWPAGDASACDCIINDASVGMCEGGAEPFCGRNLWEGCCNQYFKI